ncbi:MAG: formylglycine-generating enzyme family protein [Treponema sp.]|nr:formylglycine-generating enzyme family protein [Treponema sp.]
MQLFRNIIITLILLTFSLSTCELWDINELRIQAGGLCINHNWDWTLNAIPAKCTETSKDTAICVNSGCVATNIRNGNILALGHEGVNAILPTCQTPGNTGAGTCTRCFEVLTGEIMPVNPAAHDWEWIIDAEPPTCEVAGKDTATCNNPGCEEIDERVGSDALEHDWEWIIDAEPPTCEVAGKDTATCNNPGCEEINERIGTAAHGHYFNGRDCTVLCFDFDMLEITGGIFTMGQNGIATPTREVTLTSFSMSKYTVTQELYQAVMGINPSYFNGGNGREPDADEIQNKRPVEQVSWYDAIVFCNLLSIKEGLLPVYSIAESTDPKAWGPIPTAWDDPLRDIWDAVIILEDKTGYRLPTEAQWEYACRAGTTTDWHFGDDESELEEYAWYLANSNNITHQVGLLKPNQWGLYDMHGNVFEWCWDWWGYYQNINEADPKGAVSGTYRVERGGGWFHSATNTRSAYRDYYNYPVHRSYNLGFRLVRP